MKKSNLKPAVFTDIYEYAKALNIETVTLHRKCDSLYASIKRETAVGIIFGALIGWRLQEQEQKITELSRQIKEIREEKEA